MKISKLYLSLISLLAISCSSGNKCNTNSTPNPTPLDDKLMIIPTRLLPSLATTNTTTQALIINTSESALNNLTYSLNNQRGGANNISIESTSAHNCQTIESMNSCTLDLIVESGSIAGSAILNISNNNESTNSVPFGVQQVPLNNTQDGANSITLLYTPTVLQLENESSYVMVSYVVSSTLPPDFNTVELVDSLGNKLEQINLSPNTSMLNSGSSGTILLPVTSNTNFYVRTQLNNGGTISNQSTSTEQYTVNVVSNTAILTQLPPVLYLSKENSSQEILLVNDGDQTINDLSIQQSSNSSRSSNITNNTTVGNLSISLDATNLESKAYTPSTVTMINPDIESNASFQYVGTDTLGNQIISATQTNENQSLVPLVCSWEEIGDASVYFDRLSKERSAMGLSPDGQSLYVAGQLTDSNTSTVAKIDLNDGTQWTTVADADTIINQSLDIINALEVVRVSDESTITYIGGRSTQSGSYPIIYDSVNDGNWIGSNIRYNLGYTSGNSYAITDFTQNGDTIYATATANNGEANSFIAKRVGTNSWEYVADGEANRFSSVQLNAITHNNDSIFAGGTNVANGEAALYSSVNNANWTNISPRSPDVRDDSGIIYSLTSTNNILYAGGVHGENDNNYSMVLQQDLGTNEWSDINNVLGNGYIFSLIFNQNTLYAGGYIESHIVSTPHEQINWSTLWSANTILDGNVTDMILGADGTIYADGEFSQRVVRLVCH